MDSRYKFSLLLTSTITANGGIHTELLEGTSHLARLDDKGRFWVRGFGGCQVLLRPGEFTEGNQPGV